MNAKQRRAWRRNHTQEYINLVAQIVMLVPAESRRIGGAVDSFILVARTLRISPGKVRFFSPYDLADVKSYLEHLRSGSKVWGHSARSFIHDDILEPIGYLQSLSRARHLSP